MQEFLQLWSLPSFLAAEDLAGARRHMLQKLGHSPPPGSDDSSEVESSSTSASSPAFESGPEDSESRDAEAEEALPPSALVSGCASAPGESTPDRADAKSPAQRTKTYPRRRFLWLSVCLHLSSRFQMLIWARRRRRAARRCPHPQSQVQFQGGARAGIETANVLRVLQPCL